MNGSMWRPGPCMSPFVFTGGDTGNRAFGVSDEQMRLTGQMSYLSNRIARVLAGNWGGVLGSEHKQNLQQWPGS